MQIKNYALIFAKHIADKEKMYFYCGHGKGKTDLNLEPESDSIKSDEGCNQL